MPKLVFAVLFTCLLAVRSQGQALTRIVENNRVGYIDSTGRKIIKPVFREGSLFSERLAPVRKNGLYGYIDESGEYRIQPAFDYAEPFFNGIAMVYIHARPKFINKQGVVVLPEVYSSMRFIGNRKAVVSTFSGKWGIVDVPSRKLLADTIFRSIGPFVQGVSVVTWYFPPGEKPLPQYGVIDSTGKIIVPAGIYSDIKQFHDGYSIVHLADEHDKTRLLQGVIDINGRLLFKRSYELGNISGDFNNGLAQMTLYKYKANDPRSSFEKAYCGFINTKGEIVFQDTNCYTSTPFANGRAFLRNYSSEVYSLVDRSFKPLTPQYFDIIPTEGFKDGYAIVKTSDGWGIIDTMGRFIVSPRPASIDRDGMIGNYFVHTTDSTGLLYGITDLHGKVIAKPCFDEYDVNGFTNGLLQVMVDDIPCYLNSSGDIVWKYHQPKRKARTKLDIDYMNRGYCYAYSTPLPQTGDDSGGWYVSRNTPKPITETKTFGNNRLSVTIDAGKVVAFNKNTDGFNLFVANTTSDTIRFNAQDSRLYMTLQAIDQTGNWNDIEYLPSSWCGNSYHQIALEPGAYWTFTIPDYDGEFATKIRAKLLYVAPNDPKNQISIYSNEINGHVNPGQFFNKRSYQPNGIMDPYED